MNDSKRRTTAIDLRDAALRILDRVGREDVFARAEANYRFRHTKYAIFSGLVIAWRRHRHTQFIDIWEQEETVFSIAWDGIHIPRLAAFQAGGWQKLVAKTDIELILDSVKCSAELKRWLTGTCRDNGSD
ncbi:hypothetical protein [Bradyrhizobium sp. CCBAU 51753]|uniref:hypothetical protein n=1 Tax=Bradyrhizobium sp. CCBAU 51753 TaxID=1325100 RepID=UPI00188A546A|nr:hypothetical protein [Bradyrhizobium sp. CCBAU 51753]